MDREIDIRVEIDPDIKVPQVIIRAGEKGALTNDIIAAIEHCVTERDKHIAVYSGDETVLLHQYDIMRVFTQNRRLTVCTEDCCYESRLVLRQLEELLDPDTFVRISRFEIINLNKVAGFDMSMAGTIKVIFENGTQTWVSRRFVKALQDEISLRKGGQRNEFND